MNRNDAEFTPTGSDVVTEFYDIHPVQRLTPEDLDTWNGEGYEVEVHPELPF